MPMLSGTIYETKFVKTNKTNNVLSVETNSIYKTINKYLGRVWVKFSTVL